MKPVEPTHLSTVSTKINGTINVLRVHQIARDTLEFWERNFSSLTISQSRAITATVLNFFILQEEDAENHCLHVTVPVITLITMRYIIQRNPDTIVPIHSNTISAVSNMLYHTRKTREVSPGYINNPGVTTTLKAVALYVMALHLEENEYVTAVVRKDIIILESWLDSVTKKKSELLLQGGYCSVCNKQDRRSMMSFGCVERCHCGGYYPASVHSESLLCPEMDLGFDIYDIFDNNKFDMIDM